MICLHPNHEAGKCFDKDNSKRLCSLDGCSSHHHPTLHGAKDPAIANCNMTKVSIGNKPFSRWNKSPEEYRPLFGKKRLENTTGQNFSQTWEEQRRKEELEEIVQKLGEPLLHGDTVLLIMQEIKMVYGESRLEAKANSFFDPGSTCPLILTTFAEKYGLSGEPVTINIGTINGEKTHHTKLSVVELLNIHGERKLVRAFGMDQIGKTPYIRMNEVKYNFSKDLQEKWELIAQRPSGEVDLLIGAEVASYLPEKLESSKELVVLKSQFGTGYAMFGNHNEIEAEATKFSDEVQAIRQVGIRIVDHSINKCSVGVTVPRDFSQLRREE